MNPSGSIVSTTCSAAFVDGNLVVTGREKGLLGYKFDSSEPASGVFVEWESDGQTLELRNDPLGFIPIFYTHDSGSFTFSTSIVDLLRNASTFQLDSAAISLFLRSGMYIADRTPFSGVRVLPPGCRIRFGPRGFLLEAPDRPVCGNEGALSLREAKIRYGELFEAAIAKFRRLKLGRIAVPLSGGRDSRHILFELCRAKLDGITSLTVAGPEGDAGSDLSIARQVAGRLSVPHKSLGPILRVVAAERRKNVLTNFSAKEHAWILPLADHLATERYDGVFDGIGGDVLSQSKNLNHERLKKYRGGQLEELADEILGSEGYLPKMLTAEAYEDFGRTDAKELLLTELQKHADTPNPVGQFYFWNRTRRNIATSSFGILSQDNLVYAPYLDIDLYRFLSSLPAEFLLQCRFHDEVIKSRYPEYSDIAYAEDQHEPQRAAMVRLVPHVTELAHYFRKFTVRERSFRMSFLYLRLLRSLYSPTFYHSSLSAFTTPLYLNELHRLANGEY
jgi:asparagine synthase (glutamine-hydrolysing)